jgi:hypothetical protein
MKHLIFKNKAKAIEAEKLACQSEGLEKNGTANVFFNPEKDDPILHPSDSRVALRLPDELENRSWIDDVKALADEVVSELSEDWFGDYD